MMNISRQDLAKTILIMWFMAASVYVAWDMWYEYARKGIQQSYQNGYASAIGEVIKQGTESNCQAFEIKQGEQKMQLIDVQCLQKQEQSSQPSQKPTTK